jgi:nitrate reductase assembly molybdenum cofactor insertion protein NarJ
MNEKILNLFSNVLSYPDVNTVTNSEVLYNELAKIDPASSDVIFPFVKKMQLMEISEVEELYTLTFDIQALCSLDLGYVLFGEDYKRGEFLVNVSAMQKEFNPNLKSSELADHLPNILLLHSKMPNDGIKKDFTQRIIMPAIEKMLQSFKEDLEKSNIYARVLICLRNYFSKDYKMDSSVLEVCHV